MSPTPPPSDLPTFCERLQTIYSAASALANQLLSREATRRDIALAVELNQRYIDTLDEMLTADLPIYPGAVTVKVDGQKIKFTNIGDVAEWITHK